MKAKQFYDDRYAGNEYPSPLRPEKHAYFPIVDRFVSDHQLVQRRCLEIGCGRGAFQDLVVDYTGCDISDHVSRFLHKPFVRAEATKLPFHDNAFDAVWSVTVLEHVPQPELALNEICRVVKPGGHVLLAPAWHTRPWFAEGYPVRSFRELRWKGRCIKLSLPIRDFFLYRHTKIMIRRSLRFIGSYLRCDSTPLAYMRLRPNWETFWMSDSDAVNSLNPFDFILWFESRGHRCLSHCGRLAQLFMRGLSLVFLIDEEGGHRRLGAIDD